MPVFSYKGLDKAGKNTRGTVDAENARLARARLKTQGIYVVELSDKSRQSQKSKKSGGGSSYRVSVQDLSMMTRQLATLLQASVPLVDALGAVSDQVENEKLSVIMAEIKNMVNEGSTFHHSLAKYPKVFNKIYVFMCEAGETSGTLGLILLRLAEFTENQNELKSKVRSAMMYPMLIFSATLLMLMGIFIFIIPKMVAVFESVPSLELPWFTVLIIGMSDFLVSYWYWIVGLGVAGAFMFRSWKESENGRAQWDAIILKMPQVGILVRTVAVSRFARTLSTLLNGGVPVLAAMTIVRNVVDNAVLARAIDEARENITEGESIAGPLKRSGEFPPLVIHMISIGEKTGELENMLEQVSHSYDFQVKNQVEGFTSILGPLMLLMMGGMVAGIVFAIMIPMFDMMNFAG